MKNAIVLLLTLGLLSCTGSVMNKKITGAWFCTSWVNKATNINKCNGNVSFKFLKGQRYFSKLGNVRDSGEYKIADSILQFTPYGKMNIDVKIKRFSKDTLELLMNQSGAEEVLTLVRKK